MSTSQEHFIPPSESPADDIPFRQISARPAFVDLDQPLYHAQNYDVAAELILGGEDDFLILDVRHSPQVGEAKIPFEHGMLVPENIDFLLVGKTFNPLSNKPTGFKGIRAGETVRLGRANIADRFTYSEYSSGKHAEIAYGDDGLLSVRDLGSTNGTTARFVDLAAN